MATSTLTEEVPVEVTTNAAGEQNENEEGTSAFSKLRRRFKKGENNSKRPSDAKWRQQQIPACRPVFSAKHVFVGFIIIGLIFLSLGIAFTVILMDLREVSMDYTLCEPTTPDIISRGFTTCDEYVKCKRDCNITSDSTCKRFLNNTGVLSLNGTCRNLPLCECEVNVTLSQDLRQIVHVYYGISNFYQNHRRYLNSIDLQQVHGSFLKSPSMDCDPLREDANQRPFLPCGLIANSWFNDSILSIQARSGPVYDIDRNNIAWDTDRSTRFNDSSANPPTVNRDEIATPPNWPESILDVENGLNNEALIVWFRVSAFPWFRKLYGRLVRNGTWTDLPASTYTVSINYSYPVTDFAGSKSVILAEVSWLGGRNLFLGPAYIVVGVLLLIAAIVLLIIHLTCSKWKTSDSNFLKRSF